MKSISSSLPPSSPPPNYREKALTEVKDDRFATTNDDDPFGFLASERRLNLLKSRSTLETIIRAKSDAMAPRYNATNTRSFGKENLDYIRSDSNNYRSSSPSKSSSKGTRQSYHSKKHASALSNKCSDSKDNDRSDPMPSKDLYIKSKPESTANLLRPPSTFESGSDTQEKTKDGDEEGDTTIRSLRTRNVVVTSKPNDTTPKPKKRRATKKKRITSRTNPTKSKEKPSKTDGESSDLDDLEDDVREKVLLERKTRQEYFKRLESYEVAKENVYII